MIDNQPDHPFRKITGEHVFLVGLIVASTYMFIEATSFRDPSGLFPRFSAAATAIGAFLILFSSYLPAPLRAFTDDSGDIFGSHEEEVEEVSNKREATETANEASRVDSDAGTTGPSEIDSLDSTIRSKRFILVVLTAGYVLLSYLIGFLFASPIFALAYSLAVRHKWYVTIGLTLGSYAIVYLFILILNIRLNTGVFVG
ncbi:tripartite tricarboxylate transporter TctB family protein [Halostagnicola kamekurae]|nr:tripartite tricarboxylate transporter TctB family protein [Halostagnicola kamekurae]